MYTFIIWLKPPPLFFNKKPTIFCSIFIGAPGILVSLNIGAGKRICVTLAPFPLRNPPLFRVWLCNWRPFHQRIVRLRIVEWCMFVWVFCFGFLFSLSSHSRIFHSYGDVTIANFDICSALTAIEK